VRLLVVGFVEGGESRVVLTESGMDEPVGRHELLAEDTADLVLFAGRLSPQGLGTLANSSFAAPIFGFEGQVVEIWLVAVILISRSRYRDRNTIIFNLDRLIRRFEQSWRHNAKSPYFPLRHTTGELREGQPHASHPNKKTAGSTDSPFVNMHVSWG
jgi:hypothetical protein